MQDEKNNQPVILNLTPVNDSISQFIQLQTGILSEQEMFIPSDSILPAGTRIKVEYRLRSFGQKENVKIIDAVCEVIGPEVDSEKGRRGVRVKFLKLSPTSQMLIQKLLEKIKAAKPSSGERKVVEQKSDAAREEPKVKVEEPKVEVSEPKPSISEPQVEISETKVHIKEPQEKVVVQEQAIPSFSDVMAKLEKAQEKEEPKLEIEQKPSSLDEIMSKGIEKPESKEIKTTDDKQAQYIFEYLPPGQPLEENTGIVKLREIVRSSDISSMKKTSKIWIPILILLIIIAGIIGFFFAFPQYAPKIFVKSHEVSKVITKQDLTPEVQPQPTPPPAPSPVAPPREEKGPIEEKREVKEAEKEEEKKEEKTAVKEEKVQEPEIQPLAVKEKNKEEGVKIITGSKIKKEREKEKKIQEEKEKKAAQEKEEKMATREKAEAENKKAKKEAQAAEPGKIIIQITPTDADLTVFIDGAQAGTMPTITRQLPAGSHTIKVVADGYSDEVRKFELSEGETKTIKINLKEK
ncbi:MAG: PEGA domain-containing protein [Myxococcota bacterium]